MSIFYRLRQMALNVDNLDLILSISPRIICCPFTKKCLRKFCAHQAYSLRNIMQNSKYVILVDSVLRGNSSIVFQIIIVIYPNKVGGAAFNMIVQGFQTTLNKS